MILEHDKGKALINTVDSAGRSVLHRAISSGRLDLVQAILGEARFSLLRHQDLPPLFFSAIISHTVSTSPPATRKISRTIPSSKWVTAMWRAVFPSFLLRLWEACYSSSSRGSGEVVREMVDWLNRKEDGEALAGSLLLARDEGGYGGAPLHLAAQGTPQRVDELFRLSCPRSVFEEAFLQPQESGAKHTPIEIAIFTERRDVLSSMLSGAWRVLDQRGFERVTVCEGMTMLHYCLLYEMEECTRVVVEETWRRAEEEEEEEEGKGCRQKWGGAGEKEDDRWVIDVNVGLNKRVEIPWWTGE